MTFKVFKEKSHCCFLWNIKRL